MGIFLAFLAAIFNAIFQVIMKLLGKADNRMWINLSAYSLVAGIFTGIYALTEELKFNPEFEALIPLMLAWVAWLLVTVLNYKAVEKLDVSVNIILAQIALIVSYIGAVVFFGDKVTTARIFGVGLVIVATLIVFARKEAFNHISKKGVILRIIASTVFAIAMLLDKHNTRNYSNGIYMALAYTIPGLTSWMISKATPKEYITELKTTWKYVLSIGFVSAAAYYATLKSFIYIDASLTFTIMNFATVITVFIGVIFFKEKKDLVRKFLALIIILIAAVLLNNS